MRITYDPEDGGAAYVYLVERIRPGEARRQEVTGDGRVVLDFDALGRLLGVEVLEANTLLRPETIAAAEHRRPLP
jgi:uncharacterized protein YuzE